MSHMTMTSTPLAVAADYADALMTARRAKTSLFLLIGFLVLAQLALFFLCKYDVIKLTAPTTVTVPAVVATTQPTDGATTQPTAVTTTTASFDATQYVRYAIPVINFAVVALSLLLAVTVLLLVVIMLVGRLVGVSHVTSAFLWSVLFVILVVPWQTFFIADENYTVTGTSSGIVEQPALKWPGALVTWPELKRDYKFENTPVTSAVWMWGRYAFMPALALLVLLIAQLKSGRGLKFALGEAEVVVDVSTRTDQLVQ